MNPESKEQLLVIDVMPLLYRGHFVFLKNPRITSTGINTSALLGFAMTLTQILDEFQPSHVALAFDSATPTFRHALFPEYKAQRQKAPEDLQAAIPMAIEMAEALRLHVLRADGFEADDLMGTLASSAERAGVDCILVTPDKDVAQLVGARTRLYRPGTATKPSELLDVDAVRTHWSIDHPDRMIDLLAMAGDVSDNIPGIRGVGEKTAIALLQTYGTLENVLAHADEIKGRLGEHVRQDADQARLSAQLSRIRRDVPLEMPIDALRRHTPDCGKLRTVIEKYELKQLGQRLLGETVAPAVDDTQPKRLADVAPSYVCVQTEAELNDLLHHLGEADQWALDTETTGLDPWNDRLVGLSFAIRPHTAWYVPLPPDPSQARVLLDRFRPLLESPRIAKIGQNLKFDMAVLRHAGIRLEGPHKDTMLAQYVLDSSERHGMDHLARQLLHYAPIAITDVIGAKGPQQLSMADLPPEAIRDYACEDADIALQLHQALRPMVAEAETETVLERCEEPLTEVLVEMEFAGVQIDARVLEDYARDLMRELIDLEIRIFEAAGGRFNIASPKQLGDVLFDRLGLKDGAARTRTGQYATGEEVLQKLSGAHPIIDLIMEHRACTKLKNTYLDKLPRCVNPRTGRIHTTFSQAFTETGRLSSLNPNLQNIPIRTERGRRVRAAFVARDPDHMLLSADYSQIELRVMAAFSADDAMIEAFQADADIHRDTAARVFGVSPEGVTSDMRARAKMVNFGIIYGISPFGLARRLSIPRKEADALIDAYFKKYPGVRRYMEDTIAFARKHGFVRTLLGRRRFLRDINSRNQTSRQAAERNAINTPIQGSAADMIKMAMVRIHREIKARGLRARMVLQVHDELLFDVPHDEADALRTIVSEAMTNALPLEKVPLKIDIGCGANWLDAH